MPAPLLPHPIAEMDVDEFIKMLAVAKYVRNLKVTEVAEAIAMVFGE